MNRCFSIALLVFGLGPLGDLSGQPNQTASYDEAAAYEVYSTVLSSYHAPGGWKPTMFVIRQETINSFGTYLNTRSEHASVCLKPDPEWESLLGGAIRDFVDLNKTKRRLQAKFKLTVPYRLITSAEIPAQHEEGGWDKFFKEYPDSLGFFDVSAVGFNADKTVAVLSLGRWCGTLCGEGEYHTLQKKNGKWIPLAWTGTKCHWISSTLRRCEVIENTE